MFKSLRHFEFIFVYGVRVYSNFIDLHAVVQLSQLIWCCYIGIHFVAIQ